MDKQLVDGVAGGVGKIHQHRAPVVEDGALSRVLERELHELERLEREAEAGLVWPFASAVQGGQEAEAKIGSRWIRE